MLAPVPFANSNAYRAAIADCGEKSMGNSKQSGNSIPPNADPFLLIWLPSYGTNLCCLITNILAKIV
jgi:hypothetical protein